MQATYKTIKSAGLVESESKNPVFSAIERVTSEEERGLYPKHQKEHWKANATVAPT